MCLHYFSRFNNHVFQLRRSIEQVCNNEVIFHVQFQPLTENVYPFYSFYFLGTANITGFFGLYSAPKLLTAGRHSHTPYWPIDALTGCTMFGKFSIVIYNAHPGLQLLLVWMTWKLQNSFSFFDGECIPSLFYFKGEILNFILSSIPSIIVGALYITNLVVLIKDIFFNWYYFH